MKSTYSAPGDESDERLREVKEKLVYGSKMRGNRPENKLFLRLFLLFNTRQYVVTALFSMRACCCYRDF
jgi:hypothetical protein